MPVQCAHEPDFSQLCLICQIVSVLCSGTYHENVLTVFSAASLHNACVRVVLWCFWGTHQTAKFLLCHEQPQTPCQSVCRVGSTKPSFRMTPRHPASCCMSAKQSTDSRLAHKKNKTCVYSTWGENVNRQKDATDSQGLIQPHIFDPGIFQFSFSLG